jgi:hypothetical protein
LACLRPVADGSQAPALKAQGCSIARVFGQQRLQGGESVSKAAALQQQRYQLQLSPQILLLLVGAPVGLVLMLRLQGRSVPRCCGGGGWAQWTSCCWRVIGHRVLGTRGRH